MKVMGYHRIHTTSLRQVTQRCPENKVPGDIPDPGVTRATQTITPEAEWTAMVIHTTPATGIQTTEGVRWTGETCPRDPSPSTANQARGTMIKWTDREG